MVQRRRTLVADITRRAHEFLFFRDDESEAKKKKETARNAIKEYFEKASKAREDENGHKYLDFDEPIQINGVRYKGLQNQRKVSSGIDVDLVEAWFDNPANDPGYYRQSLKERVFKPVTTIEFDQDELYVLNQEGILPDDVLDSFMAQNVTWSLTAVKA